MTDQERVADLERRLQEREAEIERLRDEVVGASSAAEANAAAVVHFKTLAETREVTCGVFQQRAEAAEARVAELQGELAMARGAQAMQAEAHIHSVMVLREQLAESERARAELQEELRQIRVGEISAAESCCGEFKQAQAREIAELQGQLEEAQRQSDRAADRAWIRGAQAGLSGTQEEIFKAIEARRRDLVDDAPRSQGGQQ